jgi:hypothetical protein
MLMPLLMMLVTAVAASVAADASSLVAVVDRSWEYRNRSQKHE